MDAATVLVTGGTGFIGRAVCADMLAAGWRVEVLTRDAAAASAALPGNVAVVESLDALPEPPTAIVNLAGENLGSGRWNARRKRLFVDSRVGVTRRVVDYIAGASVKPAVLVSGSAVGYYGARGDELITEEAAPGDEYQADLCRAWEAEALRAREHGVRVCLLRTGAVLDAGGGPLSSLLPPFKLGLGGYYGSGRQYLPWIHRADLVRAIRFLIDSPECAGPYNATAPEPVSNRQFARVLGRVLRRPALLWVPGPLLRLMVGEMARLFLTGQRVVPARLQAAGFTFRYPGLESALRAILERQ